MSGDEPYLIRRRTSVPVVVDPDRVQAAKALLANHQVDLIISDDGLQHYRLRRDVEILIVDGERGFGNGFCLPAGPLREPISRLQTIDLVLVNGPNLNESIPFDKKAFNLDVVPIRLVNLGSGEEREVDALKGVQLTAIAALGNANRFWATLKRLGYNYRSIEYPDHHALNEDDLSVGEGIILLTEKDAVKVKYLNIKKEKIWYLEVEAIVQEGVMERITGMLA
jgi:tetraacyldisaccharide 4'-kinase